MIIMGAGGFWFPIDEFEDAWEEIEDYGSHEANFSDEKAYIIFENRESGNFLSEMGIDGWYDFPRLLITAVEKDKWGVIINDEEGKTMTSDELKPVVKEFFEGNIKL